MNLFSIFIYLFTCILLVFYLYYYFTVWYNYFIIFFTSRITCFYIFVNTLFRYCIQRRLYNICGHICLLRTQPWLESTWEELFKWSTWAIIEKWMVCVQPSLAVTAVCFTAIVMSEPTDCLHSLQSWCFFISVIVLLLIFFFDLFKIC